jgi:HEAT repeat protein
LKFATVVAIAALVLTGVTVARVFSIPDLAPEAADSNAADTGGIYSAPPNPVDPLQNEDRSPAELKAEAARLLKSAMTGRPVIRGQAARRLMSLGEAADNALLAVVGETNADLAKIGRDLVEGIGASRNEALRARLWLASVDVDFPWRPAAVSGLAITPREYEVKQFQDLLNDKLSSVRAVSVYAWGKLGADDKPIRPLLQDPDHLVRQQVAVALIENGHPEGLWWIFEELLRTDNFFDQPTGRQARISAGRLLMKHVDDMAGYNGSRPPDHEKNVKALETLRGKIKALAGERPELAAVASASGPIAGERLGIEVRSCREGEYFLRWTDNDQLLIGQGNPLSVKLPEGTTTALMTTARQTHENKGDRGFWGEPGCDLEQVHVVLGDGQRPETLIVAKGPEPVKDLRPAFMDPLVLQLVRSLPDTPSLDPRMHKLQTRVRAALNAVGDSFE